MSTFKCKMCGGNLDVTEDSSVVTCEYCGTSQTISKSRDEIISNLYNRANDLRLKCEFDRAEQIYEKILEHDNTEAAAHWGIVLCRYGIEYVCCIDEPEPYTFIKFKDNFNFANIPNGWIYDAPFLIFNLQMQKIPVFIMLN